MSDAIEGVGPATASALRRDHRYLVEGLDPATLNGGRTGLQLYLEEHGYDVFHEPEPLGVLMFGAHRLAAPDAVDGRIIMVAVPALETGWRRARGRAGGRVLGSPHAGTRARADRLEARIRDATRTDPDELLFVDSARPTSRRMVLAGARPAGRRRARTTPARRRGVPGLLVGS